MSATLSPPQITAKRPELVVPKTTRPVLWWAGVGVFFAGLALYIQGSWLLGGPHSTPTGVTPVSTSTLVAVRANEIVMGVGILALLYALVIRPLRRDRRLGFDGMLYLAFIFAWWQDPLFNYLSTGFTYNSAFVNLGAWANHIPGWNSPNGGQISEPLIWDLGFYLFLSVGGIILFSNLMRKAQTRWPGVRVSTLLVGVFVSVAVIDLLLEFFWVRTGLYTYAGTMNQWSIFPHRFYKFPLFEPIGAGVVYTAWVSLRFFVNDRGETLAERGIDGVRVGRRGKSWLRFFAIVGAVNIIFLVGYSLFIQLWAVHPGTWPKAVQERSYDVHGLCGTGTAYACGGPNVAIARSGLSIHIGPDGQLVVPKGTPLPTAVPFLTK